MKIAIKNADIVTPFRVIEHGVIVTSGRKIFAVGAKDEVDIPSGAKAYDCEGMTLTPGFVDLLVHGGAGYGFADMSLEAVENISQFFFEHGTTGLLAALYSKPQDDMIKDVKRITDFIGSPKGSNVWGIHLEGPFINKELHGAMKAEYLWDADPKGWKKVFAASQGSVKLMTIAPELPGVEEVMRMAATDGVVLSIGHSAANYQEVLNAIDNGAAHVTHMFNAMRPFHHRNPGVVLGALLHNELKIELIADGIHVHPAVMKLLYKVKGEGGILLITDAIRACGMPDGEYTFMDQKIFVKEKRAYLTDGTLAGSTLTMEEAVKNMIQKVEVPITKAVRMASLNGAKVLGRQHHKGILAVGKDADLVVLNKDFEVEMTMFEGTVKYSRTGDRD
ncbi:MAG: N-acetylglucosamine-6-phosphate deacetylase [Ignavibacteriales bacterium]|nr:N-acetylglucosamine-6-phosphate deacetylase [Ignavibacteriales bacterium]